MVNSSYDGDGVTMTHNSLSCSFQFLSEAGASLKEYVTTEFVFSYFPMYPHHFCGTMT